jgi:hypothetical protein
MTDPLALCVQSGEAGWKGKRAAALYAQHPLPSLRDTFPRRGKAIFMTIAKH